MAAAGPSNSVCGTGRTPAQRCSGSILSRQVSSVARLGQARAIPAAPSSARRAARTGSSPSTVGKSTSNARQPVLAARQARTRRTIRVAPAHGAARARGTDHWPKRSTSAAMTLSARVRRRSAPDRPLGRRTRPAGRRHRRPGRRHRPPRSRWPSGSAPDMGDTGGTEGVFAYGCVCPPFLALAKQVPAGLFGCGAPGRSS